MIESLGKIQCQLLEIFEKDDRPLSTLELVVIAYEVAPGAHGKYPITEAQLSAVRRALSVLAKQGTLRSVRGFDDGRQRWALAEAWDGKRA